MEWEVQLYTLTLRREEPYPVLGSDSFLEIFQVSLYISVPIIAFEKL